MSDEFNSYDDYPDVEEGVKCYGSWDYGLNFLKTYKGFVEDLAFLRETLASGKARRCSIRQFSHLVVLLISLRNGTRISEAAEAAILLVSSDKPLKVVSVLVKKRKDSYHRKVVLPDEITFSDLKIIRQDILSRKIKVYNNTADRKADTANYQRMHKYVCSLYKFVNKHYEHGSHALRYSFISHLSDKKENIAIISKITGHSNVNFIFYYLQSRIADKVLFNLFKDD